MSQDFLAVRSKSNVQVLKKSKISYILLLVIFFSSAVLYNEEQINYYIMISILVCICSYLNSILKPSRFLLVIFNRYSLWLTILFGLYFLYGLAFPIYDEFNADYFFFTFIMLLVSMLLFVDVSIDRMLNILVEVCAVASVAICVFIVLNEWSLIVLGTTRIGESGSGNVNNIAMVLGIMSVPCLYQVIYRSKYVYLLPYSTTLIFMLLTGSKKSLIFIFLGLIILLVLKNGIKLSRYILPLFFLIGMVFFILNNEYLYNIIGARTIDFVSSLGFNIEGAQYSNSTELRLLMYKAASDAFLEHPIFGGGWFYFSYYSGLNTYSHNNYFELLCNYGIFGFFIYYSMYIKIIIGLSKLLKSDNYAKLLFTLLIIILIVDTSAVTFSSSLLNYQILGFSYLYIRGYQSKRLEK